MEATTKEMYAEWEELVKWMEAREQQEELDDEEKEDDGGGE